MKTAVDFFAFRRQGEAHPEASATAAIHEAIDRADYANNGVTFGPFRMKIIRGSYRLVWTTADTPRIIGKPPMTFFQSTASGEFLPLGDSAIAGYGPRGDGTIPSAPSSAMLFAPAETDPGALAHPTGFRFVLDDSGSHNASRVSYWWPIAPEGYSAAGLCFGEAEPDPSRYWCVKNEYLQPIATRLYWTDLGQHWESDGDLLTPAFGDNVAMPGSDSLFIVPQTLLSGQAMNESAFALVGRQAELPVRLFDAPRPEFDPDAFAGDYTSYGLTSVKVVPYTAMPEEETAREGALSSPFYYIACEPYWLCTDAVPNSQSGRETVSVAVGSSESESEEFRRRTGLSVSAQHGLRFSGESCRIAAGLSWAFDLSRARTKGRDTSVTEEIDIHFPRQPVTWVWARQTQIVVFRTDLSEVDAVSYGNRDQYFVPEGPKIIGPSR
jgi:hypothetical protein